MGRTVQLELPIDEHSADWHDEQARKALFTHFMAMETGCPTMASIYGQLAERHLTAARLARLTSAQR